MCTSTVNSARVRKSVGGGGGTHPKCRYSMCRGKAKNEGSGVRIEPERENAGHWKRTVGRVWLALWPVANPGARQSEKRELRSELGELG